MVAKNLRYPLTLISDDTDYLSIKVVKYTPSGIRSSTPGAKFLLNTASSLAQTRAAIELIEGTILLPMPTNVNDRNSVDWDGSRINPLAAAVFETAKNAIGAASLSDLQQNPGNVVKKVLSTIKTDLGESYDALTPEVTGAIRDQLIANAVNIFNANIDGAALVSRTTGQVLNPNLELTFKGVELRNFDFQFKMTPRSIEEGLQIKGIINTFKRRMAPRTSTNENSSSAGVFLQAPDIFVMEFKQGRRKHPFLFSMKPCALRSIEVNYADGAPYSTYWDGTPVSMQMTLRFKELNPIYAEDYALTDLEGGVGF